MENIQVDPNWWRTLFDEVYLITDARSVCDDEITRREVDLICELLPIDRNHRVLDLCGGHGRHSLELSVRGKASCILLDYSPVMLAKAKKIAGKLGYGLECIRCDARKTGLAAERFDHVIIMGNSLGYLGDADGDREILAEVHRVLRSGGWMLLDVIDGEAVRQSFNPNVWHETGNLVVCRQREIRGDRAFARELVLLKNQGQLRDRTYAIKLYNSQSIADLMEDSGFYVERVLSDFTAHRAPGDYGFMNRRIVATGRKP